MVINLRKTLIGLALILVGMSATVGNALAFSEVEYLLERTGTRAKRGRLTLPEGKASTVILNI